MNPDTVIELYSGALWEAEIIKTLLLDNEIDSFIKNSILSTYAYDPLFSGGVKVMIKKLDIDRASIIVYEYLKNKENNAR
jgi:hypothetical protein